jgi:cytochrome b
MPTVRVWDLPTRLFHWLLLLAVLAMVVTAKLGGNWMEWHLRLGPAVLALLAFRVLWGLAGGHWSRFASFTYGPSALLGYLRGRAPLTHRVGHTPLGALSVYALLLVLLVLLLQVGSGLISDDEIAFMGPLVRWVPGAWVSQATEYHKHIGQYLLYGLVALHLLALVAYRVLKKQNLVAAMVHGDKTVDGAVRASSDRAGTRAAGLLVFVLTLAASYGVLRWAAQ